MVHRGFRELRSPAVVLGMLRLADVATVALTAVLAYWLREGHIDAPSHTP